MIRIAGATCRRTETTIRTGMGVTSAAAGLIAALLVGVHPVTLHAQTRPAEVQVYEFVAESDDAEALWVNPAGLGIRPGASLLSQVVVDVGDGFGAGRYRQSLIGARLGALGLGYRHDRFTAAERIVRRTGHTYSVGLGLGDAAFSMGATRVWHRGVTRASSWDLGALARPAAWLSMGLAWRDIGSPEVGGVTRQEHLTGGLGVRPFGRPFTLLAEARYTTRSDRGIQGYRAGLRYLTATGIEGFASVDLDDGGGLDAFHAGARIRLDRSSVDAVAGRPRGGGPTRLVYGNQGFSRRNAQPTLPVPRRVLRATIGGAYVDYAPPGFALFAPDRPSIQPLLTALARARQDPAVRGLLIRVRPLAGAFMGPVTALHQELWSEIVAFRESGRPVVAFLDAGAGPTELYVASAATEIVAPRLASTAVLGVNFELQRLRRTLERFHIAWDTVYVGEHKTAFHTPITDRASPEQAAWIDGLVERAFTELVAGIAAGRGLTADSVRALADAGLLGPAAALEAGLIDAVGDYDVAERRIEALAGTDRLANLEFVAERDDRWGHPPTVAVVYAQGPIMSGRGGRDPIWGDVTMGSATVARQLRAAAELPGVRAIVLRVDSPGGSAIASDEILNAVESVRDEHGLPIIASMSNVAASGGYWIAMKADTIVADPLTLTGSIGVVGAIPVFEELLDTLRVVNEQWTRGRYADLFTTTQHRSPDAMEQISRQALLIYDVFVDEVAEARGLSRDSVVAIAGGRVWFGRDARDAGLVDELGGLRHAVAVAAARGGIDSPFRTVVIREPAPAFGLSVQQVGWVGRLRRWMPRLGGF